MARTAKRKLVSEWNKGRKALRSGMQTHLAVERYLDALAAFWVWEHLDVACKVNRRLSNDRARRGSSCQHARFMH